MEKDRKNKKLLSAKEILKEHSKWIGSTDFELLVAKKKYISQRQARNIIKKDYDGKKILKHNFPDGKVICGLAEFGPPIWEAPEDHSPLKLSFNQVLQQKFCKERAEVLELRDGGLAFGSLNLFQAWEITERFVELLPDSPKKKMLKDDICKIHDELHENGRILYYPMFQTEAQKMDERCRVLYPKLRMLYDKVPGIWEQITSIVQEL
jgi:hypothetical protein